MLPSKSYSHLQSNTRMRAGCTMAPLLAAVSFVVLATGTLAHWQSALQIDIDFLKLTRQIINALGMIVVIGALALLSASLTSGSIFIVTTIADGIKTFAMAMIDGGTEAVAQGNGDKGTVNGKGFRSRPDPQHPTAEASVEEALPLLVCIFASTVPFLAWTSARERGGKSSADDSIACGE